MTHKNLVLSLAATMTCLTQVSARENLFSDSRFSGENLSEATVGGWHGYAQLPAVGSVGCTRLASQQDSVADFAIRYSRVVTEPTAVMSQTLNNVTPKKYRFGGFVKFDRPESYMTLNVKLADGSSAGHLTVNSSATSADAIKPGEWVRVELMVDLSDVEAEKLATVAFEFQPQFNGSESVVSNIAHDIYMTQPELFGADLEGNFTSSTPTNGSFEAWSMSDDGTRQAYAWDAESASRRSGILGFDISAAIPAGASITSEKMTTESTRNVISLMARTDSPYEPTLKLSINGQSHEQKIKGGAWQHVEMEISSALDGQTLTLSASSYGDIQVDNVELSPVYGIDNPRPVERTLHVTSGENDGTGSLRDIVNQASTGDEVVIDVERVNLTEAVQLSGKSIIINGTGSEISAEGCRIFTMNNSPEGTSLTIKDLTATCDKDTSLQGSFLYIGDGTSKTSPNVVLDNVTVNKAYFSGNGAAIYDCVASSTLYVTNSTFNECTASAGAAITGTGGDITISRCQFNDCVTTGSTGGVVSNINTRGNVMTISACRFDRCSSTATAGGGGAITVNNGGQLTYIDNCQFDGCSGGRANAINVYNGSRYSGGETTISNCLMINSTSSPAVSLAGGTSYAAPVVHLVNNIMCDNVGGDVSVTRGELYGGSNLLESGISGATLDDNTVVDADATANIFARVENGRAVRDSETDVYPINEQSAAYHAGKDAYTSTLGVSIISATDINGLIRSDKPSLGPTEQTEFAASVKDVTANALSAIDIRYNPARHTITINGEFNRYRLVNASGMTVLVSNATSIDTTSLAPGLYIIAFDRNGRTDSRKLIIR